MIPFPLKKYNIIYADPPWDIDAGPPWNSNQISLPLFYPTMSIDEIKNLPVKDISHKDAHLYLWVINAYLSDGYIIAKFWGFTPVCLVTWCKPKHGLGLGGGFVQTTEHLLFCKKGNLPIKNRIDSTYFYHKRLSHSEKPGIFREMILTISGDHPRIELFARQRYEGWDHWGNELSETIQKRLQTVL